MCGTLAVVHGISNRTLLEKAHLAFSMDDAAKMS
jgi:hypothetical protein